MIFDYVAYLVLAPLIVGFLVSAIRVLREYERGIVFTLGRFTGMTGPGLIILIPFVQQMVRVDPDDPPGRPTPGRDLTG